MHQWYLSLRWLLWLSQDVRHSWNTVDTWQHAVDGWKHVVACRITSNLLLGSHRLLLNSVLLLLELRILLLPDLLDNLIWHY